MQKLPEHVSCYEFTLRCAISSRVVDGMNAACFLRAEPSTLYALRLYSGFSREQRADEKCC